MDEQEQRVVDAIAAGRDELVGLVSELIAFKTPARWAGMPAQQEAELQRYLGGRLAAVGAEVDIWEPDPADVAGTRQVEAGLEFAGRPQLAATLRGTGGGRSLLLNGHIDVVTPDPVDRWTSDPWTAEIREGLLYGRGSCDMKGGVGCMVYAAEVLRRLGVPLRGDIIVNTVTDEESSGAGGIASVKHGVRADAGICPEPTAFETWVACRGSLTPRITVEGRSGHAEIWHPHWRDGGAVNAIEKAQIVIDAIMRMREDWRQRADKQHPYLAAGSAVTVKIQGGEWEVTYPSSCTLTVEVMYLPQNADPEGWGTFVEREVEEWIQRAAQADPWLSEHPPTIAWGQDIPPAEVPDDHPLVGILRSASADVGEPSAIGGLDSWMDPATYIRFADTPTLGYGPRSIAWAHTTDEYVPVEDLVRCAQGIALAAMRWCG